MPRTTKPPSYRLHKRTGQAVVTLGGQDHYLGPHGTKISRNAYDRLVGEWLTGGRILRSTPEAGAGITIAEVLAGFLDYAVGYYQREDERPSKEREHFKTVMSLLSQRYGPTPAADFGPLAFKAVRQQLVDRGHGRKYVNNNTNRMRRIFKWAVENELVPPSVFHGLQAVEGLKRGRTEAPEGEPVRPVPESVVDATLPHMTRTLAAMVRLQALTGMRPGELCIARTADIDVSGRVWVFTPQHHKTELRGRTRQVFIGPEGQRILRPFLRDALEEYIFSPAASEQERRASLTKNRRTPLSCGNVPGSNKRRHPRRTPGVRYTTDGYRQAIEYACLRAFPAPDGLDDDERRAWIADHRWAPNQVRHLFATRVRREHGLESAQVLLGHSRADVTQVYAERDVNRAVTVALAIG